MEMTRSLTARPGPDRGPAPAPKPGPTPPGQPVQLILYGPGDPQVVEGTARPGPGGTLLLDLPLPAPPPGGTPVQVLLYGPEEVIEGRTGPANPDGSFDIVTVG
jgi:hypothetical protein